MQICLFIMFILIVIWVITSVLGFAEDLVFGIVSLFGGGFIVLIIGLTLLFPFIAIDKSSGSTIGIITAVDKNFFGTTSIYIKTTENNEDIYCVEDSKVTEKSKELIGKKVQLFYGERVGFYELNKCHSAPIEKIELKEE